MTLTNKLLVIKIRSILKKAQWIQPTLYDDSVIAKEHAVISVIDDEETLILEEDSRSKMLDKQNDPISIEKKIKISPIDYSKLNKIKEDFGKCFVTQKELSAEQAFSLKHSSLSETPVKSHTPVRIEAPCELTKVSLVNESLKKLKYQLTNFDKVVKKRLTSDAIIAGSWRFEHTKKCFVTEIIPYLKVLKDTFNGFDKTLLDEITEVQTVFNQMESVVDQCSVDKKVFEIQIKQLRIDNDQLLNQIMSQEIVHSVANFVDILDVKKSCVNNCNKCLELKTKLFKKKDFIEKEAYDKLVKSYSNLEKHCISLELATQLNQEIFQRENYGDNLMLPHSLENSDLNAQLQEKVFANAALKNELTKLKGKNIVDTAVSKPNATIAPGMFKLNMEPISPRLKNNKDAYEVYIEKTIEYTNTLRGFVEGARTQYPSKPLLDSACMFTKHVQELLVYASQTCPNLLKPSEKLVVVTPMNKYKRPLLTSTGVKHTTSASGSKPSGNTKNNSITRPPCRNQKNKVEDHPRKVKSSFNKTNSIFEPISNALVKHSVRNAKFESICAICNKCLFDANHDMCLIDFVNDVNVRSKSKSKRNKMKKAWKPTGKVFTDVGYMWKPTGIFFTIVGISCPLTRITPKKIVHLKETTPKSVETPKPEIKVYSRRPKQIKLVGSSKKAMIVESKIANNSEPTHLWGSNATDVPSSSYLVNDRLSRSSFSI
ncbi:hypothetical protein Tco_1108574 [Tanacetum coccineum]